MKVKQRGSAWGIKLVIFLYKIFGYNFVYYLLYLLSVFYFIFASNVKKSLEIYYKHLDINFTNAIYYTHLRMFAITILDRFISKYDSSSYTFIHKDEEQIQTILEDKTILLLSHFGAWSSAYNKPLTTNNINIVMEESLLKGIKNIENKIKNKVENINILNFEQNSLHISIKIAQALLKNEIIAMMADRAINTKYKYKVKFFKEDAYFNANPFTLAYRTKTKILIYFIIYKNKQTYEVKSKILKIDYSISEKDATYKVIQEYALFFENILKKYPDQWFNFYNFWESK